MAPSCFFLLRKWQQLGGVKDVCLTFGFITQRSLVQIQSVPATNQGVTGNRSPFFQLCSVVKLGEAKRGAGENFRAPPRRSFPTSEINLNVCNPVSMGCDSLVSNPLRPLNSRHPPRDTGLGKIFHRAITGSNATTIPN